MSWVAWQAISSIASDVVLTVTLVVFVIQASAMRTQVRHLARQSEHISRQTDETVRQTELVTRQVEQVTTQTDHLGRQTEHAIEATRAAIYQGLNQFMLELDRIFIDNPQLRPYFYESCPEPDDVVLRYQLSAVSEMYIDLMDNFLVQAPNLEAFISEPWDDYFRDLLRRSPAMRRFWRDHRNWYAAHMQRLLDPVLEEFNTVED